MELYLFLPVVYPVQTSFVTAFWVRVLGLAVLLMCFALSVAVASKNFEGAAQAA